MKYIGAKIVTARLMRLGDYNEYRGWQIPDNEDPTRKGYLVQYEDGYESWSPLEAFKAYRRIDGMTFGLAVEAIKLGHKVARTGWNGKGMWIWLQEPDLDGHLTYIEMKTADNKFVPWLASQTDVLAEDWEIVE